MSGWLEELVNDVDRVLRARGGGAPNPAHARLIAERKRIVAELNKAERSTNAKSLYPLQSPATRRH